MVLRRSLLALVSAAALGAGGLILAAPAVAHDELIGSSPANGATLARLPGAVTLYFEEPPQSSPISVVVRGPSGATINSTGPALNGSQITEQLTRSTAAGAYSIDYRIMSDDGHPVSGTVQFSVDPGVSAGAAASPAIARTVPGSRARSSAWLAIGAAALIAGMLGLVAALVRRRRRAAGAPVTRPRPEPVPR